MKNIFTKKTVKAKTFNLRQYGGFRFLSWFCVFFLYAPILVMALYSFNSIRSITTWGGFSLYWYGKLLTNELILSAAYNSMIVALVAASIATLCATAAAFAMIRGNRFRGQTTVFGVINLPLMVPEIVTAVATMVFFLALNVKLGLLTVAMTHLVFCIPFAYLPISARLEAIEAYYEEAARDLYADQWQSFSKITFPLLLPGIISGFILAFIISLDNFIISNMVTGPGATTLPIAIYGLVRTGFTPEINAISTLLLLISVLFVIASYLINKKW